jgi:hypothetical protein
MSHTPFTMRDLFARTFCRYVRISPAGIQIPPDKPVSEISAQILGFRPARTLYQNRKPACRSLDAIQSVTDNHTCATCLFRRQCTPQICLDFLYQNCPCRLLLAYTSARNFMRFVSALQKQKQPVEDSHVRITVRDRGRWGEVAFRLEESPDQGTRLKS